MQGSSGLPVVDWFCGEGFPESSWQRSPITNYCVEHLPAPQTDPSPGRDGYAQYIDCDGPESEAVGGGPCAPQCVCVGIDDRVQIHQPVAKIMAVCSSVEGSIQCNCSQGLAGINATVLPPGSAMANYVGRGGNFKPVPPASQVLNSSFKYSRNSFQTGDNLSFPKRGSCNETQALGENGCTWKRLPAARMLYGGNLTAAGFRTINQVRSQHQSETQHYLSNSASFDRAVAGLDAFLTPRCCGC